MDLNNPLCNFNLDSKTFKELLDSQSLVDCTLACDGGKVSAHKVVLSACSSYLAKILQDHPVEHPIIILPELSLDDVKTLVHYMYTGELLKSNTSPSLLRTAAILSVNSLNDFLSGSAANTTSNNNSTTTTTTPATATDNDNNNQSLNDNAVIKYANDMMNLIANANATPTPTPTTNNHYFATNTAITSNSNNSISNNSISNNSTSNNNNNQNNGSKSEFQFKCPVCHNDFQTICSFEYHMQRVHSVTSFGCEICHKPFASLRYVLTDHMRRCHGWKAEQKLQC